MAYVILLVLGHLHASITGSDHCHWSNRSQLVRMVPSTKRGPALRIALDLDPNTPLVLAKSVRLSTSFRFKERKACPATRHSRPQRI